MFTFITFGNVITKCGVINLDTDLVTLMFVELCYNNSQLAPWAHINTKTLNVI